ncbi:MAG: sulfatase [Myxococcota bacterium]
MGRVAPLCLFGAALTLVACDRQNDNDEVVPIAVERPGPRAVVELPKGTTRPLGLLLITIDTLRADYLSCYGHARILTPSFDRLASGGVLFRQAISQSTTTTPSHASIMTGLYLQDHNVYSNFEALGNGPRTMAEIFVGRGFSTFAIVNMRHLNAEVANLAQGFQTFIPSGYFRRANKTIDRALEWLEQNGEHPFFAWIHLADVHTPYMPPPPYDRFYYDDDERDPRKRSLIRIWPLLPDHMSDHPFFRAWLNGITDVDWVFAQYQGSVTYVDDEIGRLLDSLEGMDLLHRTAIIITSDHGESLGEHEMYFVHTGLYEQTSHVPLITYFPGSGRQGVQVRDVVESVDILPTALEYFDIPVPANIRGKSMWPLIRGQVVQERVALIEHAGRNLVALRSDRFKYIKHLRNLHIQPAYPFLDGKEELYDLKNDPLERTDLSGALANVMRVFRKELSRRRTQRLDLATGEAEIDQETVEVLRALGYVR